MQDQRLHVIGCGVMQIDMDAAAEQLGVPITTSYLEAGLHDNPGELRRQLQDAIDEASASGLYDRIVIAYGICGRGLVGIRARGIPLVAPRVHDCISLFLGSDQAYRREFSRCPGTFYISAGWFEKKMQPRGKRSEVKGPLPLADYARFATKYGPDNARAIVDFLGSWRKNYKRVVFIDTGAGDRERYANYAKAMAEEFGWQYECLPGDWSLLRAMLNADASNAEVLWVPPGNMFRHDPLANGLAASPPHARSAEPDPIVEETPPEPTREPESRTRLGLGIDAGGTYTDVVVFDFGANKVLGKAKALTTRWDYTEGIASALDQLDASLLRNIDLVAVSTTLATNAIVEGQGQRVGLLVMPLSPAFDVNRLEHRPATIVRGRMQISGQEAEPVDLDEVRAVTRRMIERDEVEVFAVSGYAGTRNPAHELLVKRLLLQEYPQVAVVCGHELSDQLDFLVRANTAALNARIIPLLTHFINDVERALADRSIDARMVIVKGDGTLMSTAVARQRPIETILSGPAASVAGARYLTGLSEATVVDMGGTTSDLARVRDGRVAVSASGSHVGRWQTHVQALDMHTIGLGGDSAIVHRKLALGLGPQRIAPIAWLAAREPSTLTLLDYLEEHLADFIVDSQPMQIIWRTQHGGRLTPRPEEQRILDALADGPLSLTQLAAKAGVPHWMLLELERLENHHLVQRCGLTPTDILHYTGELALWEPTASMRLTRMTGYLANLDPDAFAAKIKAEIVRRLTEQLIKRQLTVANPDELDTSPVCRELMTNLHAGGNHDFAASVRLCQPIIGLGAPIHFFLPQAAARLQAEMIIPDYADVANALGAITSWVTVNRRLTIQPADAGGFVVHGLPDVPIFDDIHTAHHHALDHLTRTVRQLARSAGTSREHVDLRVDDKIVAAADGTEVFLERILHAEITGPPDLLVGV